MTHLSPAEFVDAADHALPTPRAAHLEACARCREQLTAVRSALAAAHAVDVPEPSPLYWEHLAARVRARVADETIVPAWRAFEWRELLSLRVLVPIASVVTLAAAVFVAGSSVALRSRGVPAAPPAAGAVAAAEARVEPDESDAWQVLTSAAADMRIDDAHAEGMTVPAGAIDRAVQRMSPDERKELARLLQSQLHGAGD